VQDTARHEVGRTLPEMPVCQEVSSRRGRGIKYSSVSISPVRQDRRRAVILKLSVVVNELTPPPEGPCGPPSRSPCTPCVPCTPATLALATLLPCDPGPCAPRDLRVTVMSRCALAVSSFSLESKTSRQRNLNAIPSYSTAIQLAPASDVNDDNC